MSVVWSDDSKISRISSDGRRPILCRKGVTFGNRRVNGQVKFGGGGKMVRGCMCGNEFGWLLNINDTMESKVYVVILKKYLKPSVEDWFGKWPAKNKWTFMQDNDPKHKSRPTMSWLQEQGVQVIPWPANSPDLNPIEFAWGIIKQRVRDMVAAKNTEQLWDRIVQAMQSIWDDDVSLLVLVRSMPKRFAAVIKAKGGHFTTY